jgi:hypothetical protein
LIGILTDPAVGGTFLNWSLHYIAGHDQYYCAKVSEWLAVPADPVQGKNAHGFIANQASTKESFDRTYSKLCKETTDKFHTVYFHNFNLTLESLDPSAQQCVEKLHGDQLVVLSVSPAYRNHKLYFSTFENRSYTQQSWMDPTIYLSDAQEILDDHVRFFFSESFDRWQKAGLTNRWDQREFLALACRPNTVLTIVPNVDLSREHYRLAATELWHTFEKTMPHLFDYLNIKIDTDRLEKWTRIYYRWRQIHYQRMLFVWYFDEIIDYIVNGYPMDLTRFDLDLVQEAVIQHELIYKHNLNLKTWQLEKFTNTKQLHDLLEPNIHTLTTY